jgi:hypothetical protein
MILTTTEVTVLIKDYLYKNTDMYSKMLERIVIVLITA